MAIPVGICQCGCGEKTKASPYTDRPRGYERGRPLRFRQGHNNRGRELRGPRYREEDCGYVTSCWVWQLAKLPNGYGQASDGRRGGAHLAVYEALRGPVPNGYQLDHLCRNRACVNPDHLEPVTVAENARRGDNAKLTYADIEEIKVLRREGLFQREVAERFGIARQTVGDIENGRTWAAAGGAYGD